MTEKVYAFYVDGHYAFCQLIPYCDACACALGLQLAIRSATDVLDAKVTFEEVIF
uniref:Uncharacterized protein n=1 Tax=Dulem virus 151 TaxID=3145628 RepID=A0AAU8AUG3_9VIRU